MEFLDEAVAKNKELPGIEWPQYKEPDESLAPERKMFDDLTKGDQEIVRNLGMRRFCHGTDTLVLCTADSVPITRGSQGDVEATDQQPRTPEDAMDYRSNEHKLASEKLTHIALRYMKCMCAAGQHNELFITIDGNNALLDRTATSRSVADIAFDLLGQQTPDSTGKRSSVESQYVAPFCWEQTILLSKVFALVEQLALDLADNVGHADSGMSLKTYRDMTFLGHRSDDEVEPTRTYEKRTVPAIGGDWVFKFPTPDQFDGACNVLPYKTTAGHKRDAGRDFVYGENNGSGTVTVDDSTADLQASRWSVAMEIEANPHAAAAWCVMLHRLLALQGVDVGSANEHTASPMQFLWTDMERIKNHFLTQQRVSGSPAGSSNAPPPLSNPQVDASLTLLKDAERNENRLPPNELATWVLAHPAVAKFLKDSRFGKYMVKVFQTAQNSWFVRQSRILELAVHWGHLQLSVPDAQIDLTPTAVNNSCYWHSALHRVMLPAVDTSEVGPYAPSHARGASSDELSMTRVHINGAQFYRAILMKQTRPLVDYGQVWKKIAFMPYKMLTEVHRFAQAYGPDVVNMGTLLWNSMNAPAKMALGTIILGGLKMAAPQAHAVGQVVTQAFVGTANRAFVSGADQVRQGLAFFMDDFAASVNELVTAEFPNVNARFGIVHNVDMLRTFLENPVNTIDGFVDHVRSVYGGDVGKPLPSGQPDYRMEWFGNAEIALQGVMHTYVTGGYTFGEVLDLVVTLDEFKSGKPPGVLTAAQERQLQRRRDDGLLTDRAHHPVMFVVVKDGTCRQPRFQPGASSTQPRCAVGEEPLPDGRFPDELFRWYDVASVKASIVHKTRTQPTAFGSGVGIQVLDQSIRTGKFLQDATFQGLETLEKLRATDPSQLLTAGAHTVGYAAGKAANSFLFASGGAAASGLAGFFGLGDGGGSGASWFGSTPHAAAEGAGASFAQRALEITESAMTEAEKRERLRQFHDAHVQTHGQTSGAWFSGAKAAATGAAAYATANHVGSLAALLSSAVRSVGGDRRPTAPAGRQKGTIFTGPTTM